MFFRSTVDAIMTNLKFKKNALKFLCLDLGLGEQLSQMTTFFHRQKVRATTSDFWPKKTQILLVDL